VRKSSEKRPGKLKGYARRNTVKDDKRKCVGGKRKRPEQLAN
jgi:hypothetical protein